jgi:zinc/manganese transport system ATP-binding protein
MDEPAVRIEESTLKLGSRLIWTDLSLSLASGQFLTVIGPNGAGKTSLLKVLLGLLPAGGTVQVLGRAPRRGDGRIGYVPQRSDLDQDLPLRGRDLVALGVEGTRWGFGRTGSETGRKVATALREVGAESLADLPVGRLSGGEQQRLRIAQALVGDPRLLLCDEPLLSLDLHHQREICEVIARWSDRSGGTVIFVTHDVNPVLAFTDRILAVAGGRWAEGTPDQVLTTAAMTELYGSQVDVLRVRGRVLVVAETFEPLGDHHEHAHEPVPRSAG